MWAHTYHRLNLVEPSLVVHQPDGVSRDKTAERVPDNANLTDRLSVAGQAFQLFLDLLGNTLPSKLDAIVGLRASIAGDNEDVKLVFRVRLT